MDLCYLAASFRARLIAAPWHEEFKPRTAWSLFNAFTEVQKPASPRFQLEGSLRLSSLFRRELQLS